MRIQVLYFAVLRERLRREEEQLELAEGTTVGGLLDELARRHPPVESLRRHLQVARNRATARGHELLTDGDEVALIPPVAGGAGLLQATPLDLGEVVAAVIHPGAGGVVTFTGVVRDESQGRRVHRLDYEAYAAMAEARLQAIAVEVGAAHGARVAIRHRTGTLTVGELAVVIAAAAPHRAEAFAACRETIERLKAEAPIWKKEFGDDGAQWVGLGP